VSQLNHLLDLKQKHANFLEAGLAREQAQQMTVQAIESGKEAKTILFLTFVTIVFVRLMLYHLPGATFWSSCLWVSNAHICLGSNVILDLSLRAECLGLLRRLC
jgi:hypothetical protein